MRKIPYQVKNTSAGTEYRKMRSSDVKWVLDQCKKLSSVAADCKANGIQEGEQLFNPDPLLIRQSTGKRNSPQSMCDGVTENFMKKQYDLSDKQCDGLTRAFKVGSDLIEDFEEVEFEQVASLPKLGVSVVKKEEPVVKSTIGDFFDLSEYEMVVSFRKKK